VFAQVLDDLLSRGAIDTQLDDLGLSVMAYTLYRYSVDLSNADRRMCIDAAALQSIVPYTPGDGVYMLSFPAHIKQ
jgi:hypothetical protein